MTDGKQAAHSRRTLIKAGLTLTGGLFAQACVPSGVRSAASASALPPPRPRPVPQPAVAEVPAYTPTVKASRLRVPAGVRPELFEQALAALDRHASRIPSHDRIAIADFTSDSTRPRFHCVNLGTGEVESLLVAHGSGSDPDHTGYLHRFSNDPGSNATCEGAFLTADYYVGKHGRSQRLLGLDATNNNALERAIVVHSAWYANPDMIDKHGKLGRSQGCFAVGEDYLTKVFAHLGEGRMIYSAKV